MAVLAIRELTSLVKEATGVYSMAVQRLSPRFAC